jgi:hypothetical protein
MIELKSLSIIDKLLVVAVLGLMVFVGCWLFGLRDFKGSWGTCTDVWSPVFIADNYYQRFSPELIVDRCPQIAAARRDDIFFVGFVIFAVLSAAFLGVTYKKSVLIS